ncbi:MAG: hypothetical protein QW703_00800, partial [Candidatus Aenigmatarchaeota archaeon]
MQKPIFCILFLIILISGCTQTGMIIDNVTQEQELPQNISIEPQRVNETQNVIEEQNLTQNVS